MLRYAVTLSVTLTASGSGKIATVRVTNETGPGVLRSSPVVIRSTDEHPDVLRGYEHPQHLPAITFKGGHLRAQGGPTDTD